MVVSTDHLVIVSMSAVRMVCGC